MHSVDRSFCSVWIVICGVLLRPGEPLAPVYVAAANTEQPDRVRQIGAPKLMGCRRPPYPTGPQCLLVTINADELVGCHLALGWRLPERMIDLSVEFRNATNGTRLPCGAGFVGALVWFGLPAAVGMDRGTSPEAVCRKLTALHRLSEAMQHSDLGRALLRGRYMAAVARMEYVGVPVDKRMVGFLGASWPRLRARILEIIDRPFGVYEHGRFQWRPATLISAMTPSET
jgi:DNA polymerase-1